MYRSLVPRMSLSPITAALAACLLLPWPALAQSLPAGPVSAFDGRLGVGADVVATFGAPDDEAYFNYTDYEHNTLRMFRLALSAAWRPISRIAVVGEVRSEDLDTVRPYAAYVRVRPWINRAFDVQFGRIPPTFGAFGRRGYQGNDNPLIGYPLAYQYLTSLRPDAAPATVADLLVMRGRGWRASYPIGSTEPGPGRAARLGVPVGHRHPGALGGPAVDVTGSVTTGTLSDPRAVGQQRRQAGVGPCRLPPDGGTRPRRVGGARRVLRSRGHAGTAGIGRLARADGPRCRRRVLARILAGPQRAGVEPVERAVRDARDQHERRRARRLGRGALPRDAPHRALRRVRTG